MDGSLNGETWRFIVRNIRIGVVEDDPASCQLVLDYLNRYQSETGEQFTDSDSDIAHDEPPRLTVQTTVLSLAE